MKQHYYNYTILSNMTVRLQLRHMSCVLLMTYVLWPMTLLSSKRHFKLQLQENFLSDFVHSNCLPFCNFKLVQHTETDERTDGRIDGQSVMRNGELPHNNEARRRKRPMMKAYRFNGLWGSCGCFYDHPRRLNGYPDILACTVAEVWHRENALQSKAPRHRQKICDC